MGERSAATRPMEMRRYAGERTGERRISVSSAPWQGLQRVHCWSGSGAPIGSLSMMGRHQIRLVQIEQRVGIYQRLLGSVLCLAGPVTLFSGLIMSLAVFSGNAAGFFRRKKIAFLFVWYFAGRYGYYTILFVMRL